MKRRLQFLLIVPALLLAACATTGNRASDLEVTIEHVSTPQVQMFESTATVKIRIDNETAEPITILGGVHHVRINGRRIGKALDSSTTEIPAFSSVTRELPLTVSNLGVLRTSKETYESKEVAYRLDSRLSLKTEAGKRTRSLRREGEVSLEELIPKRPAGDNLTPTPIVPAAP